MKILVGGIYQESHSFSNVPTDLEVFKKILLLEGEEVIERLRGTTSEMEGFLQGAHRFGFETVPAIWAWGLSSGPVTAAALDTLLTKVCERIADAGPVDGILFALHGALVAEQALDGDGFILSRLRSYVGERIPIVVTLDFHANISDQMVKLADAIVGYDTYPHIDQVERGLEAAELLVRIIRGEIKPVMALEKLPMLIVPNKQFTSFHPMNELMALAHEIEKDSLSVTVAGGFAYSDAPEAGPSALVITDGRPELARQMAMEIARRMWELREEFLPSLASVQEAVDRAITGKQGPIVLADVGDNIGAGTPGDGTFILRELLRRQAQDTVVIIADAQAVGQAIEAGVAQTVELTVGGKSDSCHGEPVSVYGRIKHISDGVFVNKGHMRDGIVEDMGRTVVLDVTGVDVVLTSMKMPPWNLEQLRSVGITPENKKIIVVKSAVAFRAAYEPIAKEIIEVDSPGLSSVNLRQFEYRHIRRPIFPLDEF